MLLLERFFKVEAQIECDARGGIIESEIREWGVYIRNIREYYWLMARLWSFDW
jgi:hypothetical protein